MLSYRHSYHAGNFADVMKHVTLVAAVRALHRKDGACYFQDTHAGRGVYDLDTPEASQNREFDSGIGRIWTHDAEPPVAVGRYLDIVRLLNPGPNAAARYYPGSPALLSALLRRDDRLLLTELHPADHAALSSGFRGDRRIHLHKQDAWQGLKAFLPPAERRGLVLIDPSYERRDEYDHVVQGVQTACARWPHGVFLIWYPLMSTAQRNAFHENIRRTGIRKILCAELSIAPLSHHLQLSGSGILIVNPPWQLDDELANVLPWLTRQLQRQAQGGHYLDWLVPE